MASQPVDKTRDFRFVSAWGLVAGLLLVGLMAFARLGGADDPSRPAEALAVIAADLAAFRAMTIFDALGWLALGGTLVLLGIALEPHAPRRARIAELAGIAQVVGVVGGLVRLRVVADLAERHAAAPPEAQRLIAESFAAVGYLPIALFAAGGILQAIGFLAAGSAAWSTASFPRWLAVWVGLPGATAGVVSALHVASIKDPALFLPILIPHILLILTLQFALAWRLRAPFPARAPRVAPG